MTVFLGLDLGTHTARAAGALPDGGATAPREAVAAAPALAFVRGSRTYAGDAARDLLLVEPDAAPAPPDQRAALLARAVAGAVRGDDPEATTAVVTVPATADPGDHRAARVAARAAGVADAAAVRAPFAVAAHYGVAGGRVLVIDLGAGARAATVEPRPDGGLVLAAEDDPDAGGDALTAAVAGVIAAQSAAPPGPRFTEVAEEMKHWLADPGCLVVRAAVALPGRVAEVALTRRQLLGLAGPVLDRAVAAAGRVLAAAGCGWAGVDQVLLAGAGWLLPEAADAVRRVARAGAVRCDRPDFAAALGAARLAARGWAGDPDGGGPTPADLGFAVRDPVTGGVGIDVVVSAGSPRPAAGSRTYYTTRHDQKRVVFEVVRDGADGTPVGVGRYEFALTAPRKNAAVAAELTWLADGRVRLMTRDIATGIRAIVSYEIGVELGSHNGVGI